MIYWFFVGFFALAILFWLVDAFLLDLEIGLGVFVVSLILLILSSIALPIISLSTGEEQESKTVVKTLVPIDNPDPEAKGDFYLGSVYVDGRRVIAYGYELKNGGYKLTDIPVTDVEIFNESVNADAYYSEEKHFTKMNETFWPWATTFDYIEKGSREFHVPEGSVIQNYVVGDGSAEKSSDD